MTKIDEDDVLCESDSGDLDGTESEDVVVGRFAHVAAHHNHELRSFRSVGSGKSLPNSTMCWLDSSIGMKIDIDKMCSCRIVWRRWHEAGWQAKTESLSEAMSLICTHIEAKLNTIADSKQLQEKLLVNSSGSSDCLEVLLSYIAAREPHDDG